MLNNVLTIANLSKYLLEGLAVAVVAFYITRRSNLQQVAVIGLTAAVTFFVLDLFAPQVGAASRQGSGFGIGSQMVGGASSDWSHSFYSQTAVGGPAAISRATLAQIDNAPVFNPLRPDAVMPTNSTGITPNGLYLAHAPLYEEEPTTEEQA